MDYKVVNIIAASTYQLPNLFFPDTTHSLAIQRRASTANDNLVHSRRRLCLLRRLAVFTDVLPTATTTRQLFRNRTR